MKIPFKITFLLVVIFLSLEVVSASYIAGKITLDDQGNAVFDVETDVPLNIDGLEFENNKLTGSTNELLTLRGGVWTLNLEFEKYDDIFLNIHLPSNLETITSISGSDNIIDIEKKIITIADYGDLRFSASYKLREKKNFVWIYWALSIIILVVAFYIYKKVSKKKERLQTILPIINENEQKIVDGLMKSPKRQKELRKELNIPKASFTRYVLNLEKKKLIIREGEGKNKVLKLK